MRTVGRVAARKRDWYATPEFPRENPMHFQTRSFAGLFTAVSAAAFITACGGDTTAETPAPDAAPSEVVADPHPVVLARTTRLYALSCGEIEMLDLSIFADDGHYEGETNSAVDTCYLIRHPKGDLLWDAGLPDALAAQEGGVTNGAFHVSVPVTLESQLYDLGVAPADIEYFAISHSHFDHVGNANLFAGSTFVVHEDELAFMQAQEDQSAFSELLAGADIETYTDPMDVFGDGTVVIHPMPGHTPGHASLLVTLENESPVLLTGDMYHLTRARELKTVPSFNSDADETRVSIEKFEALAAETGARVIIQHEADDFAALPKAPEYLD